MSSSLIVSMALIFSIRAVNCSKITLSTDAIFSMSSAVTSAPKALASLAIAVKLSSSIFNPILFMVILIFFLITILATALKVIFLSSKGTILVSNATKLPSLLATSCLLGSSLLKSSPILTPPNCSLTKSVALSNGNAPSSTILSTSVVAGVTCPTVSFPSSRVTIELKIMLLFSSLAFSSPSTLLSLPSRTTTRYCEGILCMTA